MAIAVGNPAKVNGKLKITKKPSGKVSGDEPSDTLQSPANKNIQGNKSNPGSNLLQDKKPVNYKQSPQPNNNEGFSLQNASSSINARSGLKATISSSMFGKKKKLAK